MLNVCERQSLMMNFEFISSNSVESASSFQELLFFCLKLNPYYCECQIKSQIVKYKCFRLVSDSDPGNLSPDPAIIPAYLEGGGMEGLVAGIGGLEWESSIIYSCAPSYTLIISKYRRGGRSYKILGGFLSIDKTSVGPTGF